MKRAAALVALAAAGYATERAIMRRERGRLDPAAGDEFRPPPGATHHTFTMEAPYAMNHVVPYNSTVTFSFVASTAGIFPYRCVYHQPTMTGWLVVLG